MENKRGTVPRKIKGFRDIDANLNAIRWKIIERASKVYQLYGFEHLDTPVLEYADSLGKYMPDEDTVDKGVYSFKNPELEPILKSNGQELRGDDNNVIMDHHFLSLRYDLTAPLSRVYAERLWRRYLQKQVFEGKTPLFRRYQYGPVFRFETKLDPGRFREFWQLDFDSVGTSDVAADAEVCMILSDALQAIGLEQKDFIINVNNRKILKGFLKSLQIEKTNQEQAILRILDKLDKIGLKGVLLELGQGRQDQSGAFIQGLQLDHSLLEKMDNFLGAFTETGLSRKEVVTRLATQIGTNEVSKEGLEELLRIDTILNSAGLGEEQVVFSPTLVRGMAYYTGPIFEVESTQSYKDAKGRSRKVGSICGGGRYDGLVAKLLGIKAPATGASIGVDRLAELLHLTGKLEATTDGPVLITVLDPDLSAEYQSIATSLRKAGIQTEVYYGFYQGFRKMKKQLSYADKKNCPIAILLGSDELEKGVVSVRNLKLGKALASEISDKKEFRRRTQNEVPRSELVGFIQQLLAD